MFTTYSSSSSDDDDLDERSLFSLDLSSSSSSSSSEYTSLVFNGCFFASNSAGRRTEKKEKQAINILWKLVYKSWTLIAFKNSKRQTGINFTLDRGGTCSNPLVSCALHWLLSLHIHEVFKIILNLSCTYFRCPNLTAYIIEDGCNN